VPLNALGNNDFVFYWITVGFLALTAVFVSNLFRSRAGRAFVAIRDQDIAAQVIGVDIFRYKLLAFATSSFFAGLAGALTAHYRGIISWERFTIDTSSLYLAMIIIGTGGAAGGMWRTAATPRHRRRNRRWRSIRRTADQDRRDLRPDRRYCGRWNTLLQGTDCLHRVEECQWRRCRSPVATDQPGLRL
jgi:hypothetical protein